MKKYLLPALFSGFFFLTTSNAQEPIFRMDFDSPAKIGTFEKKIVLPESGYVPGKSGKGYFFERPATNFLPADAAIPTNPANFQPGDGSEIKLNNGTLILTGNRLTVRPFLTDMKQDFIYNTNALTGSCEIKGPKGTKVTITVKLTPWNRSEKEKKKILDKSRKKHPVIEDKTVSMTYVLTGDWQRISAYAELDSRTVSGRYAAIEISCSSRQVFCLRNFQAEHTMRYPYKSYAPTSFLRGKTSREQDASGIRIAESWLQNNFPYDNGSVMFWIYLPSDPQLKRPDGSYFGFARGWRHPMWTLRNNAGSTGLKTGIYLKKGIPHNKWVHVTMTWDQKRSSLYLDGKLMTSSVRKTAPVNGKEKYILTIGRTQWTTESADGILDDFMIFGKALSEKEIKAVLQKQKTASAKKSPFRVKPFSIPPFFRDDPNAGIYMEIESEKECRITAEIVSFETVRCEFPLQKGLNQITLPFHPAKMSPGKGKLKITLSSPEGTFLNYESEYTIHKAIRRELMRVLSWGGYRPTPLSYLQSLGVNAINTTPERDMAEATKLGMLVNLDFRNHKELVRNNFDIPKTMNATADGIRKMRGQYNWYGTMLNSEAYMYWNHFTSWKDTAPYLYNLARKKFDPFPDLSIIRVSPHMVKPDELNPKPDALGIYEKPGPGYHFLKWYKNEATPVIGLNAAAKKLISGIDPANLVWVEPPFSAGQFKGMDMGGVWTYIITLQEVVGKLRREWSTISQAGCPYIQPTLTMYYWINSKERANYKGKEYFLIRSVDQLKSNCWAAAGAVGMHDLCFFNAYAWYDSEVENRDYIPSKNLSNPFGKFMREEFYPAALLLRDTKEPQATVALYLPPESAVYSEKSWNLYRATCMWERNLALYNIHFDVITADSPHHRKPESYKTLIIPMMKYVSKELHQRLLAMTPETRIVVDKDCPRTYPGMLKLDYKHNPGRPYDQSTFNTVIPFLKELEQQGTGRSFRAVGSKGDVMYFERIHKGVRYLLVINNHWQEDEISACAIDKKPRGFKLQPKGVAQGAKIIVEHAANQQIYHFRTGKKITFRKDGDKAVFETSLLPGNAELFCIYPEPLTHLTMKIKTVPAKGKISFAELSLKDKRGKFAPGRQIIYATVTDGRGNNTDETGWYVMEEGRVVIPVRIGLDAPSGNWKITVREHTTGLRAEAGFLLK